MSAPGPSTGQEQQNRLKILEDLQQQKKRLQMQTSTPGMPGAPLSAQARPKEGPSGPNRGPAETRNLDQRQRQALQMTTLDPATREEGPNDQVPVASEAGPHQAQNPPEEEVVDDQDTELQKARNFNCGCHSFKKGPCIRQFTEKDIVKIRLDLRELTEGEKDLILLGIFHTSMNTSERLQCTGRGRKEQKERTRTRSTYTIHSKRVCANAFRYLHAVSKNKIGAVQQWYREHGLTPRRKKSGGRKESKRTLKYEDTARVVQFIKNFAEEHALAFPGRARSSKKKDARLLPSTFTKASVWRNHYKPAMQSSGYRAAELSTFRKLWQRLCPQIVCKKASHTGGSKTRPVTSQVR